MATPGTNSEANEPLRVRNLATSALTVLALVVLLRYAEGLFIPVVKAVLIAYAFNPLVNVLLFWSWMWGLMGMTVAVPIMMVVKTVCDRIESLQPIGEMLDES